MSSSPSELMQASVPAAAQINIRPALNSLSASSRPPKQKEVGGWLMFFCILLIVVVPLFVMATAWSSELGFVFNIGWAAFGILLGAMLWNVHQSVFLLLWIYFGMTALILVLAIVNLATPDSGASVHNSVLFVRSIIYAAAWFIYFKRSERVRATFGRNL